MTELSNVEPSPLARLRAFAEEEGAGRAIFTMRLNQYGKIAAGDEIIPPDAKFLACVPEWSAGWLRLARGEKPVEHFTKVARPDFEIPSRTTLGEVDVMNTPNDPWKRAARLPLISLADGKGYIFEARSPTGRESLAELITDYSSEAPKRGNTLPVVTIGVKTGTGKNGEFPIPTFRIISWSATTSAAQQIAAPKAEPVKAEPVKAEPTTDAFGLDDNLEQIPPWESWED